MGILPVGTLNHFAKDLRLPLDLPHAVQIIAGGHHRKVDAAEVNGRLFVNNSSIGLYPNLVSERERLQHRACLSGFHWLLRPAKPSPGFANSASRYS